MLLKLSPYISALMCCVVDMNTYISYMQLYIQSDYILYNLLSAMLDSISLSICEGNFPIACNGEISLQHLMKCYPDPDL